MADLLAGIVSLFILGIIILVGLVIGFSALALFQAFFPALLGIIWGIAAMIYGQFASGFLIVIAGFVGQFFWRDLADRTPDEQISSFIHIKTPRGQLPSLISAAVINLLALARFYLPSIIGINLALAAYKLYFSNIGDTFLILGFIVQIFWSRSRKTIDERYRKLVYRLINDRDDEP